MDPFFWREGQGEGMAVLREVEESTWESEENGSSISVAYS